MATVRKAHLKPNMGLSAVTTTQSEQRGIDVISVGQGLERIHGRLSATMFVRLPALRMALQNRLLDGARGGRIEVSSGAWQAVIIRTPRCLRR